MKLLCDISYKDENNNEHVFGGLFDFTIKMNKDWIIDGCDVKKMNNRFVPNPH